MVEHDFLANLKVIERDVLDVEPSFKDCAYVSSGFPEITHRCHSQLKLGRSICPPPSQYKNKLHENKCVKNGISETIDGKIECDEKWKRIVQFKIHSGEIEKMEWTNPVESDFKSDETNLLHQIRYNFNGEIITNSNEYKSYTGLYNHGDQPDRAGYTISELIWLCQSTMSSQVNIALYTLCNIIETPPINVDLARSKITHYRWYSYIHNDVNLVNIVANLIERNLNSANMRLLLRILRLIFYGPTTTDFTDDLVSAYELFCSLYPEFGLDIYTVCCNLDCSAANNQNSAREYLLKESSILKYLSTQIKEDKNVVECIQILTGIIRCTSGYVIKTILNHKLFSEIITIHNGLADAPNYAIKYSIIKFFRLLYVYSSTDVEQIEYLNDLLGNDGIELLDLTSYSIETPSEIKCLIESIKLMITISDVGLIESDVISQLFAELYLRIDSGSKLVIECISEIYLLAVDILFNGNFMPFFQDLSGKSSKIINQIDLTTEGHLKLLNSLVLFVRLSKGSINNTWVKSCVYDYLDKYCKLYSEYVFIDSFDIIFSDNCLSEPQVTNLALANLLYAINILFITNHLNVEHPIFYKISNYLMELIRGRTNYSFDWNVVEKNEYKFHLSRTLPLFHCFSKFLDLPLSQFTTITTNGDDLCNVNQLMQVISLQTVTTLEREDVIRSLDLLIEKWSIYKPYLTSEFFVTEFIAAYFNLPGSIKLVALLDDIEVSLKLAKVAQIYLFNIRNPRIEDGELVLEDIATTKVVRKNLSFDVEHLLGTYKNGLIVSHVSTLAILISLCCIMETSVVETVWKDNEIMTQVSKSLNCIKCKDGGMYVCLGDVEETIVLGRVEYYVKKDMVELYKGVTFMGDKNKDFRVVVAKVGIEMFG
ncbi:hypothetical protein BmR1_04g08290 [Babesia microti strain RI]|uniref:RPAP1 C-terminal domain-containing protein n=1 Tax=Babesia microti (strain RI) TaxID=1133968 RepID=I7IHH9_BABMR|nr:hypothetical protein BmR1_04g08290 [Babesia microti strain RI]CCF75842.1 hypothetical protein BmR1_04g08290 [Babesia microti strain RI]|eukprot:XP_012650250.1 hypothetical protein BmR1_04g08290 [Babesia microti strain RI]